MIQSIGPLVDNEDKPCRPGFHVCLKFMPKAPGQDGTSNIQSNHPQPRHPPPPLPPRSDDISPDPSLMMQREPERTFGARYISNSSPQPQGAGYTSNNSSPGEDIYYGARYISNNSPPGETLNDRSQGARYISNGARYSSINSPQPTHSYKAYEPQKAVPALEKSQMLHHRPAMGELTDKNAELLEQLKLMRIECDRKTTAVDDMVTEILETESMLAEKEAEIARLSKELEQRTPQFSKMEELFKKRQEAALEEKERKIVTLQAEVTRLSGPTLNADAIMLQQQLAEKDDLLTKMTAALRAWESGWQSHMQKEKEKIEAAIEAKYSGSNSELREQTTRREQAEARLRDWETRQSTMDRSADEKVAAALAQAELQKSQSDAYLQQLRDLKDSNAALSHQIAESSKAQIDTGALDQLKRELTEARRLADFFKRNSEQASKNSKEVATANRALEEAVAAKTREVDEQNSLIQALKMQLGDMGGQQYSQMQY